MLQKVLVVLVGLFMSLVGALAPEGLFASPADDAFGAAHVATRAETTLATVRSSDGLAFARLPVLWVEVDGKRVTEDAWGTGEVEELRLKVGVKGVESTQLAVGDKLVPLKPTDVLTIRLFRGDFAYRGMGTANAALQLQGTVQTTSLNEGDATSKLRTEVRAQDGAPTVAQDRIAYVVLGTGKQVDTVAREAGGARFYTEEKAGAGAPGNVLAKWVKVDGRIVREYTWGDGEVGRIEFEPADASGAMVLSFGGEAQDAASGAHVVVKDFVGEYLVYQVQGGLVRLKLDGYAEDVSTGLGAPGVPIPSGPGAPLVAFDVGPENPRTTDVVTFRDRSTDDGVVVFWRWDFGDGVVSALQDPTHRYAKPGAYNVTLNVTDDDLHTTQLSRIVIVRNADPVADFEWLPRIVTTDSLVAFADLSLDADGGVVNWTWDFGDGQRAYSRSPTHQFARSGALTVTLTVVDDLGGRATVTKQVLVRNHPPVASFEWAPVNPVARVPVTFTSLSMDKDGRVVSWAWDFDGKPGADAQGLAVAYAFSRPGLHVVTLTVTDDGGATDTAQATVTVPNTPPTADFEWDASVVPTVKAPVRFLNRATDSDGGFVVLSEWTWGDGSTTRLVTNDPQRDVREAPRNAQTDLSVPPPPPDAEHQYARPGTYEVELCATDNFGAKDCKTKTITIDQSAPIADVTVSPVGPHYRNQLLTFTSAGSRDPDGDPIVYRLLEFGDGTTTENVTEAHRYGALGAYPVKLTVRDATGREGRASMTIYVVNRPPSARIEASDANLAVGKPVTFTAANAEDYDGDPSLLNFTWTFLPQGNVSHGRSVPFTFREQGDVQVVLVVRDADGGQSNQIVRGFSVGIAAPIVAFTMSDESPNVGDSVTFTDVSTTFNDGFRTRQWTIANVPVSTERVFTHTFNQRGPQEVVLTVTDNAGQPGESRRTVVVNAPPQAFVSAAPDGPYRPEQRITFRDFSSDADGTNTIVTRSWDFGDGTVIPDTDATDVTHAYAASGTYVVTLTVSDGHVESSAPITVTVLGRRPVAKWHVTDPAPFRVGQPVTFVSTSTDPDGDALTRHTWSWGDGTVTVGGPTETHTFATSGLFLVRLEVSDGQLASLPTGESAKYVRVGANHDLVVDISALLPHNGLQDLTLPAIDLRITHAPTGMPLQNYAKAALSGGPDHLFLRLPAGTWGGGDVLSLTLRDARYMPEPMLEEIELTDAHGVGGALPVQFRLPMPLRPTVSAIAEDSHPVLPADGGATVYDFEEPFHGSGRVLFLDGVPANGAEVTVQIRYLSLESLEGVVGPDSAVHNNPLLGWCTVDETFADAAGNFAWQVEKNGCLLDDVKAGAVESNARPVGTWQVRAIARHPFATPGTSPPSSFQVDPTGALGGGVLP